MQQALRDRTDVFVAVVMPGDPAQVRRFRDARGVTARLLADPTWATHRAYGFRRGSLRAVWLSPATWWAYACLVARGRRLRRPEQDVYHLGGDVLIDSRGLVAWIYRGRHPSDRPSIDEIVSHIDALAPKPR